MLLLHSSLKYNNQTTGKSTTILIVFKMFCILCLTGQSIKHWLAGTISYLLLDLGGPVVIPSNISVLTSML